MATAMEEGQLFEGRRLSLHKFPPTPGCAGILTRAHHPSANGTVKRLHHQLKVSLRAAGYPENWTDHLHLVLLYIRSSLKLDFDCSTAELVFGVIVRLPGEMISPTSRVADEDPANLLRRLRQFMRTPSTQWTPCCTRIRTTAYHPDANGIVKHFHCQLKATLRAADDPENLMDHLPLSLLRINSSRKVDLDCSTAELVFGVTVRLPAVHVSDQQAAEVSVRSGVPQGSVLGPTLFPVYVNDCANELDCDVAMFADDIKIWSTIRNKVDEARLQTNLDHLEQWSKDWLLPFNVNKCNFLSVGGTSSPHRTVYRLTGKPLKEVDAQKDLGVWITTSPKPSLQCSEIAKSAMSILYPVKRAFPYSDKDCFAKVVRNFVRPHLEFAIQLANQPLISTVFFTPQSVLADLKKLDPAKSPGADEIPGVLLRQLAEDLAEPLRIIFLKTLEAGKLPDTWKLANVPIHKGGSRLCPTNYRPVNGSLKTTVYRKATNTPQVLSYHSNHPLCHKRSCVRSLYKRADTHCSEPADKAAELHYLRRMFTSTGYPHSFAECSRLSRPTKKSTANQPKVWRALPYIANVSEAVARILQPLGIGIAHKPEVSIRRLVMRPKTPLTRNETDNVVYRIPCSSCETNYVGETGKRLQTRMEENARAGGRMDQLWLVAEHCAAFGHGFAFQDAEVLGQESDQTVRETLEAWHTTTTSINRCVTLSAAYQALGVKFNKQSYRRGVKPEAAVVKPRPSGSTDENKPASETDENRGQPAANAIPGDRLLGPNADRREPSVRTHNSEMTPQPDVNTGMTTTVNTVTGRIGVAHTPECTIRQQIMKPKDPLPTTEQSAVVYSIPCLNCNARYVGETGKRLSTRLHEHQLAINRKNKLYLVYDHIRELNHDFAFDKARVIGRANEKMARLVLESWSSTGTINRAIDLHPAYQALRTRLGSVRTGPVRQASTRDRESTLTEKSGIGGQRSCDRSRTLSYRCAREAECCSPEQQRPLSPPADVGEAKRHVDLTTITPTPKGTKVTQVCQRSAPGRSKPVSSKQAGQSSFVEHGKRQKTDRQEQQVRNSDDGNEEVSETIGVAHTPECTIRQQIMKPKDPLPTTEQSAVVYSIPCLNCNARYVGETGKRLSTRLHEHQLAINRKNKLYLVYDHIRELNHDFAFDKARVIGRANEKMARLVLESWSSTGTINRAIDLHPAYQALRTRLGSVRTGPVRQASTRDRESTLTEKSGIGGQRSCDRSRTLSYRCAREAECCSPEQQRPLSPPADVGEAKRHVDLTTITPTPKGTKVTQVCQRSAPGRSKPVSSKQAGQSSFVEHGKRQKTDRQEQQVRNSDDGNEEVSET
ncbi:hypothetical protein SprV_0401716100 [Sparganum proliferum]